MTKSTTRKVAAKKPRDTHRKTAPKVAAKKAPHTHRKTAPKLAAEKAPGTHRKTVAQFDEFQGAQVPATMPLTERSVAQTRELYERSKNTLLSVLESWEKTFGAASKGTVALNRKIIDIAERNIKTGFDLAAGLAGAKTLADIVELQAAFWRKQFGVLTTQAEEVRALSTKVTAAAAEPIKSQMARGVNGRAH